jgi:hypothetical protein
LMHRPEMGRELLSSVGIAICIAGCNLQILLGDDVFLIELSSN